MSSWYACAEKGRAFKVVREIGARNSVVLVNWCGTTWEEKLERLHACGYREVSRRPAYAERGSYAPKNERYTVRSDA